jgi:hypothetical protein
VGAAGSQWVSCADDAPAGPSGACREAACLDRDYFNREVAPLFAAHCAVCHVVDGVAWGSTRLPLTEDAAWDSLVDMPSLEMAAVGETMMRVKPGMPESSYLYLKITRDIPPLGSRMPLGGSPLPPSQIDRIAKWIKGRP